MLTVRRGEERNSLADGARSANHGSMIRKSGYRFSEKIMLRAKSDRGRSSMVERQLPKLHTRVRFPSPAPSLPLWEPRTPSRAVDEAQPKNHRSSRISEPLSLIWRSVSLKLSARASRVTRYLYPSGWKNSSCRSIVSTGAEFENGVSIFFERYRNAIVSCPMISIKVTFPSCSFKSVVLNTLKLCQSNQIENMQGKSNVMVRSQAAKVRIPYRPLHSMVHPYPCIGFDRLEHCLLQNRAASPALIRMPRDEVALSAVAAPHTVPFFNAHFAGGLCRSARSGSVDPRLRLCANRKCKRDCDDECSPHFSIPPCYYGGELA